MRWLLPCLIACSGGPLEPKSGPTEGETLTTDSVDSVVHGLDDTGDSAVAEVPDPGPPLPSCEELLGACIASGELPAVCDALAAGCVGPWEDACVSDWEDCLAAGRPPLDCAVELLTCVGGEAVPVDTADPCADAWADCRAAGRDTASCVEAVASCGDTAGLPDTGPQGGDTSSAETSSADTAASGCAAHLGECAAQGLDPAWCAWFYDGCLDADGAPAEPCVTEHADCLAAGGSASDCQDLFGTCVLPPPHTGGTCRSEYDACRVSGGSVTACTLDLQVCMGLDPDLRLTCDLVVEACVAAGGTLSDCQALGAECMSRDSDTSVPAPSCTEQWSDCVAAGRDSAECVLLRCDSGM